MQYLRGLKRSLKRLLPRPQLPPPDLAQSALLERLAAPAGEASGGTAGAGVAYFDRTISRAGFFSADEAAAAVGEYQRQREGWHESLQGEVSQILDRGLPVYARQAGPLRDGLDWGRLPEDEHGDRLYALRPHRFGFLPRLAMAACCGCDTMPALLATLESWIDRVARKGGQREAYFSNLVVIYRILAISLAASFSVHLARRGDRAAETVCLRLLQILGADIQHLVPRLGHSVGNNHLLADRFAGWLLASCHPDLWPQADAAALEALWLEELGRQFQEDGTNFEQSVHYHEIGCEMATAYLVLRWRRGGRPPGGALALIGRMLRFQAALADPQGCGFALGDTTEDPLLPLDGDGGSAGGAWRRLYRQWFDPAFPPTEVRARGGERAYWLLAAARGLGTPPGGSPPPEPVGSTTAFPCNGYVVFADDGPVQRVLFRTGPREDALTSPGHAMSDLLTVYWNAAGRPILEPAGTYSYAARTAPAAGGPGAPRDYFRGPAAHNGFSLVGHDPLGLPAGPFRGGDNGTRVRTRWGTVEGILGWAEGELRESGPLRGYRRGVLCIAGRFCLVYDRLPELPADSVVACRWQAAPEARVAVGEAGTAELTLPGLSACLVAAGAMAGLEVASGRAEPAAGWLSRRYGGIEAAPQLIYTLAPGAREAAFVLGLAPAGNQAPPLLSLTPAGTGGLALMVREGERRGIACFGDATPAAAGLRQPITFRGDALWLDFAGGDCYEVRAIGLRHLRAGNLAIDWAGEEAGDVAVPTGWRCMVSEAGPAGLSGHWRRVGQ